MAVWLLAAPALASHGAAAPHADQGDHGQGQHSAAAPASSAQPAQGKAAHEPGRANKPAHTSTTSGKEHKPAHTSTTSGKEHKPAPASAASGTKSPAPAHSTGAGTKPKDGVGNNGTVKIDRLGDMDRIPNNVPHPGCTFQVEWFGFDGGPDVLSRVTFTMQAPTRDVGLTVNGPSVVPVGGDRASGAGTSTGPDAVQAYTLSFSGAPQARQGYHVRLTVATPRSRGNDTKTKVFWVAPCTAPAAPAAGSAAGSGAGAPGAPAPDAAAPQADSSTPAVLGISTTSASLAGPAPSADQGVASPERPAPASDTSSDVPLAVDAGQGSALSRAAHSPWLALGVAGLLVAGVAGARRLRGRA